MGTSGLREVCWDIETTGLYPESGDRIIDIGCVELVDKMPTGRTLHLFIDPEREVPEAAVEVHGMTREILLGHGARKFSFVVEQILDFFGDAPLIAHNAPFDVGFMNAELARLGRPGLTNPILDTFKIATQTFGTANASLGALCKRFSVDLGGRALHGALIDAQLLAGVYLELNGGRSRRLDFSPSTPKPEVAAVVGVTRPFRPSRGIGGPTADELARHAQFVGGIKGALWSAAAKFVPESVAADRPPGL